MGLRKFAVFLTSASALKWALHERLKIAPSKTLANVRFEGNRLI